MSLVNIEEDNDEQTNIKNEKDSGELQAILNSLTGQPNEEDELLYAIPIIAPYNTLAPYKWIYIYLFIIIKMNEYYG